MQASDVTETLDLARAQAGVDRVRVVHRPRLLSDNGPCYVSQEFADYLGKHGLTHTRGAPYHPMTQGKIERYHRSMKNVVKLEKYFRPWDLKRALAGFVEAYNHRRYHSLDRVDQCGFTDLGGDAIGPRRRCCAGHLRVGAGAERHPVSHSRNAKTSPSGSGLSPARIATVRM